MAASLRSNQLTGFILLSITYATKSPVSKGFYANSMLGFTPDPFRRIPPTKNGVLDRSILVQLGHIGQKRGCSKYSRHHCLVPMSKTNSSFTFRHNSSKKPKKLSGPNG